MIRQSWWRRLAVAEARAAAARQPAGPALDVSLLTADQLRRVLAVADLAARDGPEAAEAYLASQPDLVEAWERAATGGTGPS